MAITLNGSSQYGYMTTIPSLSYPITMGAWVNTTTAAVAQCIMTVGGTASVYHLVGLSSALNKWYIASRNGGSESYAASTTAPSTGTWVHVLGVFASATSRVIYVNGANEGNNTTSLSPSVTKFGAGVRVDGAIPAASPSYFSGSLAEVAVWDAALSDADIAALAKGISPKHVMTSNLQMYFPFVNNTIGVVNVTGDVITLAGSPTTGDHPRIYP